MPSSAAFKDHSHPSSGKAYDTGGIAWNQRTRLLRLRRLLKPHGRTYTRILVTGVLEEKQVYLIPREG